MTELDLGALESLARSVREHAHAPYSDFRVGAAVRARSGKTYVGCNVENASFGATVCAERNAVAAAVAAGEREIVAVAVYTEADAPALPCGICRQVIQEFGPDAVVVSTTPTARKQTTLRELLPEAFVFRR
ncbi:MAG: cytidine deaminase [Polyangiaceae bacterium]|nr:cytidine deaminase [Polyangiaceae bacterium]MCE7889333.1 cytidine deaminase [Sorangiineae bacterium PRO1]MCL4752185.1 cytidine deaminase [Myxococcales bacterium]